MHYAYKYIYKYKLTIIIKKNCSHFPFKYQYLNPRFFDYSMNDTFYNEHYKVTLILSNTCQ